MTELVFHALRPLGFPKMFGYFRAVLQTVCNSLENFVAFSCQVLIILWEVIEVKSGISNMHILYCSFTLFQSIFPSSKWWPNILFSTTHLWTYVPQNARPHHTFSGSLGPRMPEQRTPDFLWLPNWKDGNALGIAPESTRAISLIIGDCATLDRTS